MPERNRQRVIERLIHWIPSLLWMGVIFYFSSREKVSVSDSTGINFIFFKSLHVIEYAILFYLNYRSVSLTSEGAGRRNAGIISMVITFLYAASDELHQTLVPSREGRLRDVIIDTLGMTISWILIERLPLPELLKPKLKESVSGKR